MKSRDKKESSGGSDASKELESESFSNISKDGPKVATEDKSNDKRVAKVSGNKTIFERSHPTDKEQTDASIDSNKMKIIRL